MLDDIPFLELFIYLGLLDIRIFIRRANLVAQEFRQIVLRIAILVATRSHCRARLHLSICFKCLFDEHRHKYIYPRFDFHIQILVNKELIRLFRVIGLRFFTELGFIRTQADTTPRPVIIALDVKQHIRAYDQLELRNKRNRILEEGACCHIVSTSNFFQYTFIDAVALRRFLHNRISHTFEDSEFWRSTANHRAFLCDSSNRKNRLIFA